MNVGDALLEAEPYIAGFVRRTEAQGEDVEDLTARCLEAVWARFLRFDTTRGVKFGTWVWWVCRGALRDWRRWEAHGIHIPQCAMDSGDFGPTVVPLDWAEPELADPEDVTAVVLDRSETFDRLRQAMTYARRCGLTARQWECLVLWACADRYLTVAERGSLGVARAKLRAGRAMLEA